MVYYVCTCEWGGFCIFTRSLYEIYDNKINTNLGFNLNMILRAIEGPPQAENFGDFDTRMKIFTAKNDQNSLNLSILNARVFKAICFFHPMPLRGDRKFEKIRRFAASSLIF